jgi:hypothetical protein
VQFTADEYYDAAMLRYDEARALYLAERFVGAVYLAGRAVEAVLRAIHWRKHQRLECGHDLRELLADVGELGFLTPRDDDRLTDRVNEIAVVWNNDLRFASEERFLRHLKSMNRDRRVAGRRVAGNVVKANALSVINACEAVLSRGSLIWHRSRTS